MVNETPQGDPEGRRLAALRALVLSEASAVSNSLRILLDKAGVDSSVCDRLLSELANRERTELTRAHGHVESRKRYRKFSGQPILDQRPISNLYLDENGKSNPEPGLQGPRMFSLGAIAMNQETVDNYIYEANHIKKLFFGRTNITFHEPEMRNRYGMWGFLGDTTKQTAFDKAIEELIQGTEFYVFGTAIRKTAFLDFINEGLDPYLPTDVYSIAITFLLERYLDYLGTLPKPRQRFGRVTFESIGPKEDADHQIQFAKLLLDGTQWVADGTFRNYLETGLRFVPKVGSHPLELADMFSRDLYEWVRDGFSKEPKRWDLFSQKIHCRDDGLMGKFGVKIFPDSDIREVVEAHRSKYGAKLPAS